MFPFAVCCVRMSWCPELFFQPVLMSWIVFPTCLDVLNCLSNLSWCPELSFQPVLMSRIVFPTCLDVLNCFSNLSWCPELFFQPVLMSPTYAPIQASWLTGCKENRFLLHCLWRVALYYCLFPWEWSLTAGFLRMILWSLTAGFPDVLMFQTYLMKTDHPLLFISWEWSHDL